MSESKVCPNCNTKNNPTFNNCWKCGAAVATGNPLAEEGDSIKRCSQNEGRSLSDFKSIYSISKFKYIQTMVIGQHFVVSDITASPEKERLKFNEPLVTIGKDCFILTDKPSMSSAESKRAPIVIKLLKNMRDESILVSGMGGKRIGYRDEGDECVSLTTIGRSSFLCFMVRGKEITLYMQ